MSMKKMKLFVMGMLTVGAISINEYGVSDREKGEKALENAGYTDIEWKGHNPWSGFKTGIALSDKFQAVSPDGKIVDLTVGRDGVFSDEHIIKVVNTKPKP